MYMQCVLFYNADLLLFQQYSAGIVQYKNNFQDFGNFDPKEVKKEVKRGNKLVRQLLCQNSTAKFDKTCQYVSSLRTLDFL